MSSKNKQLPPPLRSGTNLEVSKVDLSSADCAALDRLARAKAKNKTSVWRAYRCRFEDGSEDRVAFQVKDKTKDKTARDFLITIWPLLRETCVSEAISAASEAGDAALLWMISKRIAAAVLILDKDGRVIRTNSAGRDLISKGDTLRLGRGGLQCADDRETLKLRKAIASCADQTVTGGKETVIISGNESDARLPISLTRFPAGQPGQNIVVAVVPKPPDSKSIEMLAAQLGLTPTEARVASLVQLGLSNREASGIAGMKEQSFRTYSKRVFSKLNVSCRAEMAQLLTWQAAGERLP